MLLDPLLMAVAALVLVALGAEVPAGLAAPARLTALLAEPPAGGGGRRPGVDPLDPRSEVCAFRRILVALAAELVFVLALLGCLLRSP